MSLHLDRVVGTSSALVASHHSGIGWLSGSWAVLTLPNRQVKFNSRQGRPLKALGFSPCGGYIAVGEGGCASPEIQVFDLSTGELKWFASTPHSAVSSIFFSSQGLLASLGTNDSMLQVYELRTGQILMKHNLQSLGVKGCFTEDGNSIITSGKSGHFKVWSISQQKGSSSLTLNPKPVSLAKDFRSSSFVAVESAVSCSTTSASAPSSSGGIYALTSDGNLILMRATGRSVSHHVSLHVSRAFDLSVSPSLVACACESGLVRIFNTKLQYQTNLPRPSPLVNDSESYPDAVSLSFSPSSSQGTSILTVAYSDREIFVYDVGNMIKVARLRVFSSHTNGIFAIKSLPHGADHMLVTSSADGSIKLWNNSYQAQTLRASSVASHDDRISLKPQEQGQKGAIGRVNWSRGGVKEDLNAKKKEDHQASSCSIYCMDVSSDGLLIAAGDERGNIQVINLKTMKPVVNRDQVHDGPIQTITFSPNKRFLASGGRDGLIHLFELFDNDMALVDTVDEHDSSAVTGLAFDQDGSRLLSCGADRSFVAQAVNDCSLTICYKDQLPPFASQAPDAAGKRGGSLLDLALDKEGRLAVIAASDSTLHLYDLTEMRAVGKVCMQSISPGILPVAVRVVLDPTGTIAFCSCLDGSIHTYYLPNGSLIAASHGSHGGVASSFILSSDLSSIVSVGGDGVMMHWRVPSEVQKRMIIAQPLTLSDATPMPDVSKSYGSDGGLMASTLIRVQQGKPLLSHDKLPRWARPTIPTFDLGPPLKEESEAQAAPEVTEAPALEPEVIESKPAPQEKKKITFIQRVLNLRLKSKKDKAAKTQTQHQPPALKQLPEAAISERDQPLKVVGRSMSITKMEDIPEEEAGPSQHQRHWADLLEDDQVVIFSTEINDEKPEFTVKACENIDEGEGGEGGEGPQAVSAAGSNSENQAESGDASGEASIVLPPRDLFKEHYLHHPELDTGRPSEASVCTGKQIDPRRQSLSTTYRQLALTILKDRRKQQASPIKESIVEVEAKGPEVQVVHPNLDPNLEDLPVITPALKGSPQRCGGRLEAELARMRERLQSLHKKWDHTKKIEKAVPAPSVTAAPQPICALTPPDADAVHPPLIPPDADADRGRNELQDNPMFNSSTPLSTFSLTPPLRDGQIFSFDQKASHPLDMMEEDEALAPRVLMENAAFISMERGGGAPESPFFPVPQDRRRPLASSPGPLTLIESSPSNFQVAKRAKVTNKLPPFKRASPVKTATEIKTSEASCPTPLTEFKTRAMHVDGIMVSGKEEINLRIESIELAIDIASDANDLLPLAAVDQDARSQSEQLQLSDGLDRLHLAALEAVKLWATAEANQPRNEAAKAKLRSVVSLLQGLSQE